MNKDEVRQKAKSLCKRLENNSFNNTVQKGRNTFELSSGLEELALYNFRKYIFSCAYYLNKKYQKQRNLEYVG